MIIFYKKDTGKIIGTIDGRIHPSEHLNMWVGNKNETDRIICQWQKGSDGNYYPDHKQKDIFAELDKDSRNIRKYQVNTSSRVLEPINKL